MMQAHRFPWLPLLLFVSLIPFHVRSYEPVQCYWAPNEELPYRNPLTTNSYIPCGDIDDGVQPCCRIGHNCLDANACYAPEGLSQLPQA